MRTVETTQPYATVVGIPGRVVRINGKRCTPQTLLQHNQLPDPIAEAVEELTCHIVTLEKRLMAMGDGMPAMLAAESPERTGV